MLEVIRHSPLIHVNIEWIGRISELGRSLRSKEVLLVADTVISNIIFVECNVISTAAIRRTEGQTVKFLDFALLGALLAGMSNYPCILIIFFVF